MPDTDRRLPWPYALLAILWFLALPAVGLWYITSRPGFFPADVRDDIRPWAIRYLALAAVVTAPLFLLGRRQAPKIREENEEIARAGARRAAALAALRPSRLSLPARRPGDADAGPVFEVIAKEILVRPEVVYYLGQVIACPDYLIVVVTEIRSAFAVGAAVGGGAGGGMVGGVVGGIVGALADRKTSPLAPLAMPLPDAFRKHRDWPAERRTTEPAIILPRAAARDLRTTFMGGLQFQLADRRINVPLSLFSRSRTLATLRRLGWPV